MKLSEFLTELNNRIAAAKVSGFWTDTQKEGWINMSVDRVSNFKNWKDLEDKQIDSTVKDQEEYTYPTTLKTNSVFLIEIDDEEYIKKGWDDYREYKEEESDAKVFSIFKGEIYINPIPDAAGTDNMVMWGFKKPVAMPHDGVVFTVTIATPGVFSKTTHGLAIGDKLRLTTTGALPTGLTVGTDYYIIAEGFTANAFEVSTTLGGAAVNTSGSQSGTHKYTIDDECTLSDEFNESVIKLALATCLQKERRYREATAEIVEVEAPKNPRIEGSGGLLAKLADREEGEGVVGYIGKAKSSRWD